MSDPQTSAPPRRTPLYETHKALGARLVPFAGWEMPVQYSSALEEHHTTRKAAGLFDVSHMGEVTFEGPRAFERLQGLVTNDLRHCADGQAQYSAMLYDNGGIIDDIIVYRFNSERFLVCVNAGNRDKDFAWMNAQGTAPGCTVTDRGDDYGQLAVQGPKAPGIVQSLTKTDLSKVKTYGSWADRWRAWSASSRAPATRAKTALSCSARRIVLSTFGMQCLKLEKQRGFVPSGSVRAISSAGVLLPPLRQ